MTVYRAKIGFVFVASVLLFSILPLLYWDFVRETIIVPIYYVVWVIGLYLESIAQGIYLVLLVFLSLFIGYKTLGSTQVEQPVIHRERKRFYGSTQYLHWRSLYTNLYISPFSRIRFVGETRKLVLSILAYEQGIDAAEAEALVRNGKLDVPDPIRDLIETKFFPDVRFPNWFITTVLRLRRWLHRTDPNKDTQIDNLIAEIIDFIEVHLEINHAGNQPKA